MHNTIFAFIASTTIIPKAFKPGTHWRSFGAVLSMICLSLITCVKLCY